MTPVPHRGVRLCAAVLATAVLMASCQRAGNPIAEAAIERAARGSVDAGSVAGGDAPGTRPAPDALPLPAQFPGDVYLPRGYRVNSVMDLPDASVLSLSAPGHLDALFADARESMRAQGWTQTLSARHSADAAMLAFEKRAGGPARSATLSFNRNHGDARVIVGVQLRRQVQ
jgi:hypothetical protein